MAHNEEEWNKQFFRRQRTRQAIDRLAGERRITIVVGAGASAEVGFPLWSELVERLLLRALSPGVSPDSSDYPPEVVETAHLAITEGGALGAATMARAVLGDRFDEELRNCLYDWPNRWQWNRPGSTAWAVARLYAVMTELEEHCEIATTNYDLTLEKALEEELEGVEVRPFCLDSEEPEGHLVVRHLHGVLTEDGTAEEVTLTEADYHPADATNFPWQESYLRQRLEDSTVIFIGASLTDQHLLRYIFRYAKAERPPIALLVQDADEAKTLDKRHAPNAVEDLFAELRRGRWEYAHLTALQADFRSQPGQFLHEISHHKESPTAVRYGKRLDAWYEALSSDLGLASRENFRISQHEIQEIIEEWLDTVAAALEDANYDLSEETLAVHLWCRSPARLEKKGDTPLHPDPLTSLALIGCSDRTWTHPGGIDIRLITQPSSRAAVDAFCRGNPQVQFPQEHQKWRWILASPVMIEEDPVLGRLPVGAVTLVSDRSQEESVLSQLEDQLLNEIEDFLTAVASDALTPGQV
ncbi:MAG TPA: SIR2 family protein [Solirubrobacterales bacterium]|nr:SIR2 family protein [Solirubrobacterales bacterium]